MVRKLVYRLLFLLVLAPLALWDAPGGNAAHDFQFPVEANWSTFNYQPGVFWTYGCTPLNGGDLGPDVVVQEGGAIDGQCSFEDPFFTSTGVISGSVDFASNAVSIDYDGALTFKPPSARTYEGSRDGDGTYDPVTHSATGTGTYNWHCEGGGCSAGDIAGGTGTFDWTLMLGSSIDVSIDHIEVVQVVQDAGNTIPLVANKTTIARVFVEGSDALLGVSVSLKAGSLSGTPQIVSGATGAVVSPSRENTDDSWNYLLPDSWTGAGSITLEAEATLPDGMSDPDADNNKGSVVVTFQERGSLVVAYLPVCYQPPGQATDQCPTDLMIDSADGFMDKIFPAADGAILYKRLSVPAWHWKDPITTFEEETALIAAARKRYDFLQSADDIIADQLAVWLPDFEIPNSGLSDPVWFGSTGRVSYSMEGNRYMDYQHVLAHEIAHNLGRRHTNREPSGCTSMDPDTDWPAEYVDSTVQEIGYDVEAQAVVPASRLDLMSYCSPPLGQIWVSPHTYRRLFQGNFVPLGGADVQSASFETLIISGHAEADGSAGTLDPAYQIASATAPTPSSPGGNHCLLFGDASDVLGEYCFNLSFVSHQEQLPTDRAYFSLQAPLPAGTTRVALMRGPTQLALLQASPASPSVDITSHQAGEALTGTETIAWSSSDDDGDPLTYTILYSPDAGVSWLPLDVDVTDPQLVLDTADIQGGSEVLFRVLASDGLNTGEETLGPVTVGAVPKPWGDLDCDGGVNTRDNQVLQRHILGQNALSQTEPCPDPGDPITVLERALSFGDVDCDGDETTRDNQVLLREALGQNPLSQTEPCPDPGEPANVSVAAAAVVMPRRLAWVF